jgi:hypothetical protein
MEAEPIAFDSRVEPQSAIGQRASRRRSPMVRRMFLPAIAILLFVGVIADSAGAQSEAEKLHVYGYFATRFEKTYNEPSLDGDKIVKETSIGEWTYPSLNIMMQHQIDKKVKAYLNLNGGGASQLDVRNFWGEYAASPFLNVRLGKIYRKFGLYNELLDAVPTYYGIEPPELFDADHLIVSRTTTLMLLGMANAGSGVLSYALSTDNGEGSPFEDAFPLGYDLRYKTGTGLLTVGTSGYLSNGPANSDVGVGEGSPKSGVLPWMAEDDFSVMGGFAEANYKSWMFQAEFWHSNHDAKRDPASTVAMIEGGHPNATQLERFLINPSGAVEEANIDPNGDYKIDTWYFRAGYSIESKVGEFGPYMQYDFYKNPETIGKKKFGGDNEAGVSDDGQFVKWTLGVVYRPAPAVAVKLDGSQHRYVLGDKDVDYPELRFDVSYIF